MAVETLTKAVIRNMTAKRSLTEEELAQTLDVITDDPKRPRWHQILGERVRERMIFAGDSDSYTTAKEASDGLEHGYLELDTIAAHALRCADKTFGYVRRTILELFDLSSAMADELMTIKPMDVQSRRKIVRGLLMGAAVDPAPRAELYPLLEWRSSIHSVLREGSTFQIKTTERITVQTHPDVRFRLDGLEVRGRLEDGHAPIEMSNDNVIIESTPERKSDRLLAPGASGGVLETLKETPAPLLARRTARARARSGPCWAGCSAGSHRGRGPRPVVEGDPRTDTRAAAAHVVGVLWVSGKQGRDVKGAARGDRPVQRAIGDRLRVPARAPTARAGRPASR